MVVDMLSLRPAAEKPPASTTRTNAVRLVSRSISSSDYPSRRDNASNFSRIITGRATLHLLSISGAPRGAATEALGGRHVECTYVSETDKKISLKPSRTAIRRAALALALVLGVAAAA